MIADYHLSLDDDSHDPDAEEAAITTRPADTSPN
jgi:hypothetical protein